MSMSPELLSKMAIWRQKAATDTLDIEEMREAVAAMRQGRRSAASAPAKRSSSTKAAARPADDLLKELEGL